MFVRTRSDSSDAPGSTRRSPIPSSLGCGALGGRTGILDGEVAVIGPDGSSDFQALAPRMHVRSAARAHELAVRVPVTYVVFDVLKVDGRSTISLPYVRRREVLEGVLESGSHWQVSRPAGGGADLLEASRRMGIEGIVAKRLDSPYRPGQRSPDWIKIKNMLTQEVVLGGYTVGEGRRSSTFGSLLLGLPVPDGLTYVGAVGTGFDDAALSELSGRLRRLDHPESRSSAASTHAMPERRGGFGQSSWERWPTASGPPTTGCGTRSGAGCERTRSPRKWSVRPEPSRRQRVRLLVQRCCQIAQVVDAGEHGPSVEAERQPGPRARPGGALDLVPCDRRRDGGLLAATQ